ncbi:MAG: hypothetical protein Ta2A_23760 [Treponemataceae bacterium]|nr:MAG: hypothetical protein Ta2A_23760 [Treponemataceae bacterium]
MDMDKMDRNAISDTIHDMIIDAMEAKAEALFGANISAGGEYTQRGKRGAFTVQIRNAKNPGQWDSSLRHFGTSFWESDRYGELTINDGCNFEAGMMGKIAYSRRTGKNSGVHHHEVLGGETFWPGAVVSADGNCICAFGGLSAEDDVLIARAGIAIYDAIYESRRHK